MLYSIAILLISVIVIVWCWRKKGILGVAGLILLALALAAALFFAIFDTIDKSEIIELDKFDSFSGKSGNKYYYTVLLNIPSKNTDSIRKIMIRYFNDKSADIESIDSGSYIGHVSFYRYSRKTAYFIDHDEDHGGFSSNTLDMYLDQKIGFILTHFPCVCDSTRYMDIMEIYDEPRDTLYWECDSMYINNWDKYR